MTDKIFNFLVNYFSNINDRGVDEMNNFRGDITSDEIVEWLKNIQNTSLEQPSEDLEYLATSLEETIGTSPHSRETILDHLKQAAQWQKEKILESAVDATCVLLPPPDLFKILICHEMTDKLANKQKIKILIVME